MASRDGVCACRPEERRRSHQHRGLGSPRTCHGLSIEVHVLTSGRSWVRGWARIKTSPAARRHMVMRRGLGRQLYVWFVVSVTAPLILVAIAATLLVNSQLQGARV